MFTVINSESFVTLAHDNGNGQRFQVRMRPQHQVIHDSPYQACTISQTSGNTFTPEIPTDVREFVITWSENRARAWGSRIASEQNHNEKMNLLAQYSNTFTDALNLALTENFPPTQEQAERAKQIIEIAAEQSRKLRELGL